MLHGPQLFELFDLLEPPGRQVPEAFQKVPGVGVYTQMLVNGVPVDSVPPPGNGGPREVERIAMVVEDHLDVFRIGDFAPIHDGKGQGAHLQIGVVVKGLHDGIETAGVDQRLIALDVDDHVRPVEPQTVGGFGDAVRSGPAR